MQEETTESSIKSKGCVVEEARKILKRAEKGKGLRCRYMGIWKGLSQRGCGRPARAFVGGGRKKTGRVALAH
jgi:hypothetical protein